MKHSKGEDWRHACLRPWKQILCCFKPRQVMVKHTHTHTNNFPPGVEDCYILKSSHISSCRHARGGQTWGNTGLSPLILIHLRGTSCFLSGMFSLASSALPPPAACWISSDLSVIGHRVAHSQPRSLQLVLNVYVCERLTLYLCAFGRTLRGV